MVTFRAYSTGFNYLIGLFPFCAGTGAWAGAFLLPQNRARRKAPVVILLRFSIARAAPSRAGRAHVLWNVGYALRARHAVPLQASCPRPTRRRRCPQPLLDPYRYQSLSRAGRPRSQSGRPGLQSLHRSQQHRPRLREGRPRSQRGAKGGRVHSGNASRLRAPQPFLTIVHHSQLREMMIDWL